MIEKHGRQFASQAELRRFEYQHAPKEDAVSAILQTAAEVTGLTQQAIEKLHELTTYQLSSAASTRHKKAHEEVRRLLVEARNKAASLTLILGKEGL